MQQTLREKVGEKVEAPGKRSEAQVVTFAPCADRRSVRTRRALRSALAQEVDATGDLSRVTVTAVTERAGVTRRTFYSHFRDIPDLVDRIERETLAELTAPLARLASCHLDDLRAALAKGRPAPGAPELLACVLERADYPEAFGCADRIAEYVEGLHRTRVTDAEKSYLVYHLVNLVGISE